MLSSSKEEIAMSKSCRWGLLRKYYAHSHAGIPAHDLRDHLIDTATEAHIAAPRNVPDGDPVASSKMLPLPHRSGPVLPAAEAAVNDDRSRVAIVCGCGASLLNDSTARSRAIARRHAFNRRCRVRS
jgi:hypothetical protein